MRYPDPLSWKIALGLTLWTVGVWLAGLAHPSTLDTSFLGSGTKVVGVGSQFYQGNTAYLHMNFMPPFTSPHVAYVTWSYKGKLQKKTVITVTKAWHYSSCSVSGMYGEWTVSIVDCFGNRRTHHFVVRRKT